MERRLTDCPGLPQGWKREEILRNTGLSAGKSDIVYYRQTASIFKQPVTVIKNHHCKAQSNAKHGNQEVPKQLFWEKRLQGLSASDANEEKFTSLTLPKQIQGVGPDMSPENLLQSIAAALHTTNQPVNGQTAPRAALNKNPGVHINAEQPLVQHLTIKEDDVREQEQRVLQARTRLENAIKQLTSTVEA